MNKWRAKYNRLLCVQGIGFLALVILSWLDEYIFLPRNWLPTWFGQGGWREAIVESAAIALVGVTSVVITYRLMKKIHRLESFLRVCAWCRKVDHDGMWVSMEEFFEKAANVGCTHGICESCLAKVQKEIEETKIARIKLPSKLLNRPKDSNPLSD